MPDEIDLGCDRAEEIRESQIAKQLNHADKTRLEARPDGTCLNDCGEPVEIVQIPMTPEQAKAAAALGIKPVAQTKKSFFCSKECAEDHGKRERSKRAVSSPNVSYSGAVL